MWFEIGLIFSVIVGIVLLIVIILAVIGLIFFGMDD